MNHPRFLFSKVRLILASWIILISFILPTHTGLTASFHEWDIQMPGFEPAACMFTLPAGAEEGKNVLCGYVSVPEEHSKPDGKRIRLAVVIYKSQDPNRQPDPLFIAQGGPGGSTIDTYAEPIFDSGLLTNRDIVLFDQRGTLKSDPVLYCDEYDKLTADLIEKDLPYEEYEPLEQQAVQACRQRLVDKGIDLSAYDSLQNAADVEAVRQALGYDQINLYGVSYGTLLALHTLRQHPENLRSVIMDGVVPPQVNFNLLGAQTENRAFTRLFEACRQDPACNSKYPDLEKVFFDLVDQLDAKPALVKMTDSETGAVYNQAVIDGETFLSGIFQMLYAGELIPALPRMIYDARDGYFDVFARILSIFVFDRSMSYGMYYSVICAEDADFDPADQPLDGVRPYIVTMEKRSLASLLKTCQTWNVEPLGPAADQPVTSDVPVLLLSGYFDPVTPADFAEQAATTLKQSYSYVFPDGGHGQMLGEDCANSMILSFLDDPSRPPEAACLQDERGPVFYTPATIIDLPALLPLLNLDPMATIQFGLLFGCMLLLGSSYLVYPIAWLVGKASKPRPIPSTTYVTSGSTATSTSEEWRTGTSISELSGLHPSEPAPAPKKPAAPRLVRAFSWMAALASLLLAIFLIAFVAIAFSMALDNDSRLFYGMGSETRPLFFLPPLFALLTLGMLVAIVQAWSRRNGSVSRRLYNTLLVLAALVATIIFGAWGVLTGWLPL